MPLAFPGTARRAVEPERRERGAGESAVGEGLGRADPPRHCKALASTLSQVGAAEGSDQRSSRASFHHRLRRTHFLNRTRPRPSHSPVAADMSSFSTCVAGGPGATLCRSLICGISHVRPLPTRVWTIYGPHYTLARRMRLSKWLIKHLCKG